ncbi:MAG: 2,4-diaminopentanoate dehydrogenase [Bacilli bacterium]
MRKEKIKVIIWGFGAMGSGMGRMIASKQGFQILGAVDKNPSLVGHKIQEVIPNIEENAFIWSELTDIPDWEQAEICLLATDSFTEKAFPKIEWLVTHHINVISTAEEMAYPQAASPELAKQMDELAKKHHVRILGTGVNPGVMMDLLVLFLSGVMVHVDDVHVDRINSLSPFGKTVMEEQGVGLTVEAYNSKKQQLYGHVGFQQSIQMMADGLGLDQVVFHQEMNPIITKVDRISPYGCAKANHVCGIDMKGIGLVNDHPFFQLNHPQQIEPHLGGVKTKDYIKINGNPSIQMTIEPEVDGGLGTIAICVNMIPLLLNATPGLKTMLDLPVPRAICTDVRKLVEDKQ